MLSLAQKSVIITGAAAGIGRASALLFAQHGAQVVCVDTDASANSSLVQQIVAARGETGQPNAIAVTANVADEADVERVLATALAQFGKVDILFNNAGVVPVGKLHTMDNAAWQQALSVNVTSVFLFCKHVLPHFLERRAGVILNTASTTALRAVPDRAAYNATKAAVVALTKSMAVDYAREGIRVNCLCPGTVDTPSLRRRVAASGDFNAAWNAFIARQPLGRLGSAEEIAQAALYLVSDEAAFITGTAFQIDGGMSA